MSFKVSDFPKDIPSLNRWIAQHEGVTGDLRRSVGIAFGAIQALPAPTQPPTVTDVIATLNHPTLFFGTDVKSSNVLVTTYLKNECILTSPLVGNTGRIVLAEPTGNYNSYVAAWVALALITKAGLGEVALAKNILDTIALIPAVDGSWFFEYNPFTNAAGTSYNSITSFIQYGVTYSGDYKPGISTAMLIYAMSAYDIATAGTLYKSVVQNALNFLRTLQNNFVVAQTSNLLANSIYNGTSNNVAILGDSALALLAMHKAMTAYGTNLTATPSGYAISRMANDLYYSLTINGWAGDSAHYYNTTFPVGMNSVVPIVPFKAKQVFTQMLCAWANFVFQSSAFWVSGGTGTVNTTGTAVLRASGTLFNTNEIGQVIVINGVNYTIASVTDGSNLVLTSSAGNQAAVAYSIAANVDNHYQAENSLDFIQTLNTGQYEGQFFSPFLGNLDETTDELAAETGYLLQALAAVNSGKYARAILGAKAFLQWLALADGRVFGLVDSSGGLWKSKVSIPGGSPVVEGYGFLALPSALGLVGGA